MVSGVMTNLVIAFVLFAVVLHGPRHRHRPTTRVAAVVAVRDRGDQGQREPAAARLHRGRPGRARQGGGHPARRPDRVLQRHGRSATGTQLQTAIRDNAAGAATIVVQRDGRTVTLTTNTTVSAAGGPEQPPADRPAPASSACCPATENVRQSPGFVVSTMASGTWATVKALGTMPVKLYHVGRGRRSAWRSATQNGPMSVVGAGRVAGEIASHERPAVADRFFSLLLLLAGLQPVPGDVQPRAAAAAGRRARSPARSTRPPAAAIARLRRRPDPGYVDVAKLLPVAYVDGRASSCSPWAWC